MPTASAAALAPSQGRGLSPGQKNHEAKMSASLALGQPTIRESTREIGAEYQYSPADEAGGFLFVEGQFGIDEHGEAPEDPAE